MREGRQYFFSYWLAIFMVLNGVYALFDQLGLIAGTHTPQADRLIGEITIWPIVFLGFFGGLLLAVSRFLHWKFVAIFAVAINPAFRLYFYLVGPIIDPFIQVNWYFSFVWLFLLIFFSAVVYREVGFDDVDDSRPRIAH